jgi:hypothetical protein
MKARKIGMAWYEREDYEKLKKLFTDGGNLPATYDQWFQKAEDGLAKLRRDGYIVVKAYINPQTFAEWCRIRGLNVNADGRIRFAAEFAARGDLN